MKHYIKQSISELDEYGSDDVYSGCDFKDKLKNGGQLNGTFVNCIFDNIIFYWAIGHNAVFVNCKFLNCDLRVDFFESSFVSCVFDHCATIEDNLGGEMEWEDCLATNCEFIKTSIPPGCKISSQDE